METKQVLHWNAEEEEGSEWRRAALLFPDTNPDQSPSPQRLVKAADMWGRVTAARHIHQTPRFDFASVLQH